MDTSWNILPVMKKSLLANKILNKNALKMEQ